jgi:hypothetical protein
MLAEAGAGRAFRMAAGICSARRRRAGVWLWSTRRAGPVASLSRPLAGMARANPPHPSPGPRRPPRAVRIGNRYRSARTPSRAGGGRAPPRPPPPGFPAAPARSSVRAEADRRRGGRPARPAVGCRPAAGRACHWEHLDIFILHGAFLVPDRAHVPQHLPALLPTAMAPSSHSRKLRGAGRTSAVICTT